jgi:Cu2+-containing amine oxidase
MPRTRLALPLALAAALQVMAVPRADAAYCTTGTELTQDFPTSGPAVSQWHLCWEILRMPNDVGALVESETLVLSQVEFRPGATATPVTVLGDMRMAEIFVPYHSGDERFHDLTDFAFDLQPLTTTECPGTRLAGNKLCVEVRDRQLAWRDPYGGPVARRGETLVLWGLLNADNYDYVMAYEFDDDGTIQVRAGSTGQKLDGPDDTAGHFHNFAWRVNLDVAGAGGDTVHLASTNSGLTTTRERERTVKTETGLKWSAASFTHVTVEDATHVNGNGRLTGYTLAPVREGLAHFGEAWTRFPIWVTRNQGPTAELRFRDVPTYLNNESVQGQDLVVWYFDSHNHESNMRDEDRDAVPISWMGFRLEPQNVWDGTPFY